MAEYDFFPSDEPAADAKTAWTEILILFFTLFVPGILVRGRSVDPASFDRLAYHLDFYILALPQIALILYLTAIRFPHRLDLFGITPPSWKDLLWGILTWLGIFAVLAAAGLFVALLPNEQRSVLESGFRWRFGDRSMLPFALITSLITGYREELFFRSYLLTRFDRLGIPFPVAALVSTLMFATGHLYQGWAGFLVAAALGGYLCLVFRSRRSLHVTALAHAFYNFSVLLFLLERTPPG